MGDILPEPYRDEPQFQPRDPLSHPGAVPDSRLGGLMQEHIPSLVARDGSSTSSAASSSSTGEKSSGGSNITTPVVVGTIVPLAIAVVVMIFLHRRHVRKLRQEDAEDKHGSLDFGLGEGRRPQPSKSRWKKQPPPPPPEMTMDATRNALRKERGLSLDVGGSPYILPPDLHHSRESLHSMSRSPHLGDDKYQRTNFIPDDGSIRSPSIRKHGDDSSSFSGSTRFRNDADSSRSLIHATNGLPARPAPPPKAYSPVPADRTAAPDPTNLLAPAAQDGRESMVSDAGNTAAFRASNDYLGAYIGGGAAKAEEEKKKDAQTKPPVTVTEREVPGSPQTDVQSPSAALPAIVMNEAPLEFGRLSDYSDHPAPPPEPKDELPRPSRTTSMQPERQPQLPQLSVMDFDSQSTTPQDMSREPSDYGAHDGQAYTPEDRSRETSTYGHSQQPTAAHSREQSNAQDQQYDDESDYYDPEDTYSVYEDYADELGYDPRRLTWGVRPLPPDDPSENPEQRANRIRSFYKEYFDESGKPGGGNVAQYYDGSEDFYDDYYGGDEYFPPRGMSAAGGRHRAMSNGSHMRPGPRAFSSASGRYGMPPPRGGPRMPPKRRAPPPKALNELPTPHKLKDDTFLIDLAVDFAPPDKARFQRSGTPNSSRGGQRPFSPSVRAFTPLQSSYDDLAVLPSPHLLRKSGTFTALDFAPPGRVHVPGDSMSETGSIRSARSGISRMHEHSIRTGAYRVSRIPRGVAGTRDEIHDALKPTWDIGRK